MKYLLTSCLLLLTSYSYGQAYIPFPDHDALWLVRHGNHEAYPTYYYYGLKNEDTTILGITYHTVFRSADTTLDDSEAYGGIREAGKKVYFFDPVIGSERILYDFGVSIGDTVYYTKGASVDPFYLVQAIVSSIDSINISGVYHRQINFKLFGSSTEWLFGSWIEGVGNSSVGGYHKSVNQLATCDCSDHLICFKSNNTWVYHNPEYSSIDCDEVPLVGIQESPATAMQMQVYPNPIQNNSTLAYKIPGEALQLEIYNMNGAIVQAYTLSPFQQEVLLNGYAKGLYHYRFYNREGQVFKGLIDIH